MGAWSERNFRLLFVGQTASALGNTLVPVALAFAVLRLTGSAADLGLVLGAGAAAILVVLVPAGVAADRASRRSLMIGADTLRFASETTLGLLLVTGHPSVATLGALSALTGGATGLFSPASTGLIPALVAERHLQQANALQKTAIAAAGIAGPALAGLLVVTVGAGWAIIGDGATFAVSVATLWAIDLDAIPRPARRHFVTELREGWLDFWSRRWFRTIVASASVCNLLYAGYTVLGPVASERAYHGASTWALVSTAGAVGSVIGGLIAIRLRPKRPLRFAVPFVGLAALAPLAFAARLPVAVLAVAAGLGGAGILVFDSLWETSVQRHIPEDRLSRLSAYDWFGSLLAYPVGLAIAGPLAVALGLDTTLAAVGILLVAIVLVAPFAASVRNLTDEVAPTSASPR